VTPSANRVASMWLAASEADLALPEAEVKYIGAFLDASSWRRVVKWFAAQSGERLLPTLPRAPHLTIKFAPTDAEVLRAPLGSKLDMQVVSWASDEYGQAVGVVVGSGVRVAAPIPHITIANASGTKAVYSNKLMAMLRASDPTVRGERVRGPKLSGAIQVVYK